MRDKFLERCRKKFGNKFDYSRMNFISFTKHKIIIVCPIHGVFEETPHNHLQSKYGCRRCSFDANGIKHSLNTDIFKKKIQDIYGDNYITTNSNYINNVTPIEVFCKKHELTFYKTPHSLFKKYGCPECGKEKYYEKMANDTNFFISESIKLHGNVYTYDYTNYINNKTKVIVTCKLHGNFETSPNHHLSKIRKHGCPKCGRIKRGKKIRITFDEFINRIPKVLKKFRLYKSTFFKLDKPMLFKCLKCNTKFLRKPTTMLKLNDTQCPECYIEYRRDLYRSNTADFIAKAIAVHGDKYDYTWVNYIDQYTDIEIFCNSCKKMFKQKPAVHLAGSGCKRCRKTTGEHKVSDFLIENKIDFVEQYKITEEHNRFRFDFYIPSINTLIEYDGHLHFIAVDFFGGEKTLQKQKRRDKLKNQLAKKHNYKLIRINYKSFYNLEEVLRKQLILYSLF
jgi:very-short-patch-repair endonuclease